jgi:hypothetical protein
LAKSGAIQNTLAFKDAASFRPPNTTVTVSTKTDLSSNQSDRLAFGFETLFPQIQKRSDISVVKLLCLAVMM